MDSIKLVCFDVDGTLVDGVSWLLLTQGLGCSEQAHLDIFLRAKKGKISFIEGERELTKMYQDSGNATRPFIKKLFANIRIKPETKEVIDYLKEKGYFIYLISGAIDIYVEEVAKKLKVDGYYANSKLDFDEEGVLKKINYRDNQEDIKAEQLKELVQKLKLNINEVVFVGDSENDIEVFKRTRHGIAVNSFNENLKEVAWKIVDSLKEVKRIL